TAYDPIPVGGDAHMFRSPMRFPAAAAGAPVALSTSHMLLLRSAIAAINAIDLRDGDDDISSRQITLPNVDGAGTNYLATVYGTERQPFITEVYADSYNGARFT